MTFSVTIERTAIRVAVEYYERDDLDLELLAPGAWGIAGMHGGFAKPRYGAGDRCSDPLKGSYLKMMSASGAFDVDSDRIVAVCIRDASIKMVTGPLEVPTTMM